MSDQQPVSDELLVRSVLGGDREQFRFLVERYLPGVMAIAYAHAPRSEAEDIAQEAFMRAFTRLDSLRGPSMFGAWVLRIARNTAADRARGRVRVELLGSEPQADQATPADRAMRDEAAALIQAAMDRLRESEREVLLLHYFAGHSAREVGDLLGLSRSAVLKRLERARHGLGAAFREEDLDTVALRDMLTASSGAVMRNILAAAVVWKAGGALSGGTIWANAVSLFPKAGTIAAAAAGMTFMAAVGWMYMSDTPPEPVDASNAPTPISVIDSDAAATVPSNANASSDTDPRATVETSSPLVLAQAESGSPDAESSEGTAESGEAEESTESGYTNLSGLWDAVATLMGVQQESVGRIRIADDGTTLSAEPEEEALNNIFPDMKRVGSHITLSLLEGNVNGTLSGSANDALDQIVLTGKIETPAGDLVEGLSLIDVNITLTRVDASVLGRDEAVQALIAGFEDLYDRITSYHTDFGAFPARLRDLIPTYLDDDEFILTTPTRIVTYNRPSGFEPDMEFIQSLQATMSSETDPNRLMDIELALIELWQGNFFGQAPMIEVYDEELEAYIEVSARGNVEEVDPPVAEGGVPDALARAQEAAQRATSQNNLKQIGIGMKMFQNEQAGNFFPAGWHMLYPQYIVDRQIFRKPTDPAGIDSYELLYPAANEAYLQLLGRTVEGLPEGADASAYVPIVIERESWPIGGGRNVLYLDGHVTLVKDEDWDRVMGPYLAYR